MELWGQLMVFGEDETLKDMKRIALLMLQVVMKR